MGPLRNLSSTSVARLAVEYDVSKSDFWGDKKKNCPVTKVPGSDSGIVVQGSVLKF